MGNRPLSIVHFIGFGAPVGRDNQRSVGGVEVFVHSMLQKMDPKRFHHTIVYATDSPMIEKFQQDNIEIIRHVLKSKFAIFSIIQLAWRLKSMKINVIHSHALRYDFAGAIISLLTSIPLIITRHVAISDYLIPTWKKFMYLLFDFMSMFVARYIIAISDDARGKIIKSHPICPKKVIRIYCGIDFNKYRIEKGLFLKNKRRFRTNKGSVIVGTVAQLRDYKGIDLLLNAAVSIIDKFPIVRFIIIGDGPARENLQKLTNDLRIVKYISFVGFQKEIFTWISLFDIFAMPSRREGLPIAILEAMYAKKPILATNVGAVREVVCSNWNGQLIDSDSLQQVIDALTELIIGREKWMYYGENSYSLVTHNFDITIAASRYEQLFLKIAGDTRSCDKYQ